MNNPRINLAPNLEIENRLAAEVNLRIELRGEKLVLVVEPGRTPGGLYLPVQP